MAKPLTIVISGPSGSGKSTHIGHLKKAIPNTFGVATSHTTREPRAGEVHGREYHFVNKDAFQKLVQEGGFIEHAQFGSNYYGTSWQAVKDVAEQGRICILDIEMEGVKQIRSHPTANLNARFLFLSPPSLEVLEKRLRGRGTDKEEAIQKRLAQAKKEMEYYETNHDKKIVNDDENRAFEKVKQWILTEMAGSGNTLHLDN